MRLFNHAYGPVQYTGQLDTLINISANSCIAPQRCNAYGTTVINLHAGGTQVVTHGFVAVVKSIHWYERVDVMEYLDQTLSSASTSQKY